MYSPFIVENCEREIMASFFPVHCRKIYVRIPFAPRTKSNVCCENIKVESRLKYRTFNYSRQILFEKYLSPLMDTFADKTIVYYHLFVCRQRKTKFRFPVSFAANKQKCAFFCFPFAAQKPKLLFSVGSIFRLQ
jgi:hypothetical protein